ncbi:holin [Olsenella uli]|uniref:holin n=1 Tax=Olsenella uli TaxID=133926 RepID=UPI00241E7448|nr:holin [Olsenella uli]
MGQITSKEWWAAAGVRALKTGAQALATLIGTGAVGILDLDWPQMLSVTATMMVLSLLTSLAGLPEVGEGQGGTDAVA